MAPISDGLFIWAEIPLIHKEDETTRTIYVTNRPVDLGTVHYPLLTSTSGLTIRNGNYIPDDIRASLLIDDSPSSFGHERRFSDLFERETPLNQEVKVKVWLQNDGADVDPATDGTTQLTAKCSGWRLLKGSNQLRLELADSAFERRYVGKIINSIDFSSAPTRSLGKSLPITFSDNASSSMAQVKAYQVANDSTPTYAYATTLGTEHPVGGVNAYYAKSGDEYLQVQSASAASTPVINPTAPDSGVRTIYDAIGPKEMVGTAVLDASDSDDYIITGGRVRARGNGAGGTQSESYISVTLCEDVGNSFPNMLPRADARIDKRDYENSIDGSVGTWFWMDFSFDKPFVVDGDADYYMLFNDDNDTGTGQIVLGTFSGDGGNIIHTDSNQIDGAYWFETDASNRIVVQLYGVKMTDSTSAAADVDGYGYASFECTQNSAGTGQTAPDLVGLDFIVDVDGLRDDSSGTITGTNNKQIIRPDEAIRLITQTYNGTAWSSPTVSDTQYSTELDAIYDGTGTYTIDIAGATSGRVELRRWVEDVCRNAGARIFERGSGLEMYAEGTEQANVAEITDEHANVLSVTNLGTDNALFNRAIAFCRRRIIEADIFTGTAEGNLKNYWTTIYADLDSAEPFPTIIGNSETLYGSRNIKNPTFDWLPGGISLTDVIELMLRRWVEPVWLVKIQFPVVLTGGFDVATKSIKVGDVIKLIHPDIPAYLGTSSDSDPAVYDGAVVKSGGKREKRARPVRGQIESRSLKWSGNSDEGAALEVDLRIIGDKELT